MALLSDYFAWFKTGNYIIQAVIFGTVFIVTGLFYSTKYQKTLHFLLALIFVSNTTTQLLAQGYGMEGKPPSIEEHKVISFTQGRIPPVTPNIYLLVYDAYVSNETMLSYGIDNRFQEEYLIANGFTIYPHTYSVATSSIETMSRVLNVSTELFGKSRRGVSGDGIVQNKLKDLGYETYGIFPSDFFFRGIGSSYDVTYPVAISPQNILVNAILMGEFRSDIGFNKTTEEQFTETKEIILEGVIKEPAFIYAHSNLPDHSQNSGVCLPDETDLFKLRLARANFEMRQDINSITQNDPLAIVIVAGDHGPYLTKNCSRTGGANGYHISEISRQDIQDRYGTFLAIKWPTADFTRYDDITVLQDLFPVIFAYLFEDEKVLESKIEPATLQKERISGASVQNGIIVGGINDGESLFISGQ